MKKINSINWGGKVLGLIVFLDAILPISAFLVLLLELYQDKKIDQYYCLHRKGKKPLSNDSYECEQCGNREIKEADTYCKICHTHFENDQDKPPYSRG